MACAEICPIASPTRALGSKSKYRSRIEIMPEIAFGRLTLDLDASIRPNAPVPPYLCNASNFLQDPDLKP